MHTLRRRALAALRDWSAGSAAAVARRSAICGVLPGTVAGGILGFGIGVAAYLPTSPVAMVEGSVFGAALGSLLSAVLFAAIMTLRWTRR